MIQHIASSGAGQLGGTRRHRALPRAIEIRRRRTVDLKRLALGRLEGAEPHLPISRRHVADVSKESASSSALIYVDDPAVRVRKWLVMPLFELACGPKVPRAVPTSAKRDDGLLHCSASAAERCRPQIAMPCAQHVRVHKDGLLKGCDVWEVGHHGNIVAGVLRDDGVICHESLQAAGCAHPTDVPCWCLQLASAAIRGVGGRVWGRDDDEGRVVPMPAQGAAKLERVLKEGRPKCEREVATS